MSLSPKPSERAAEESFSRRSGKACQADIEKGPVLARVSVTRVETKAETTGVFLWGSRSPVEGKRLGLAARPPFLR